MFQTITVSTQTFKCLLQKNLKLQALKVNVVGAEVWYPKETKRRSIVTRDLDMANLEDLRREMVRIADEIRAEAFIPTPGDGCRNCPATSTCPALESGVEAFSS